MAGILSVFNECAPEGYEHFERDDPTGLLSSGEQAACSTCHSKAPTDHVFSRIRP